MQEDGIKIIGKNRRAFHDYHVDEKIECGVVLHGTEVKSLRAAHFNFSDSYARFRGQELWLIGFHINSYAHGNLFNHEPDRDKKLMIHKNEGLKLRRKAEEKGFTLVPLTVLVRHGFIKIEIGVCRGKKSFDKRDDIKRKDMQRETDRDVRSRFVR